jgi:hypothetical protein
MSKTNKESSIINRDSEDALNYCEKEKMGFIPWVVAAKIADHVADPGYIVARASRGEHGCGETPARCGGVEEDRRFGADELKS